VNYGHHLSDPKEFLPTPGQGEEVSVVGGSQPQRKHRHRPAQDGDFSDIEKLFPSASVRRVM
jgi:hypothetical protein